MKKAKEKKKFLETENWKSLSKSQFCWNWLEGYKELQAK